MYLTFHKLRNKAMCHHCSFEKKIRSKCKLKGSCELIMYGIGVERILEEVKEIFPNKKIIIFSSDYLKKKKKMKKFFKKIQENHIDILIGTQMILKGLTKIKLHSSY